MFAVTSLLTLTACGGNAGSDDTITLTVADSKSLEHYVVENATVPWMDRIEQLTNGKVEFEFYPAEQLGGLGDYMALLQEGTADVAYVPPAFFEGEMPLSEVHTLPGLFEDSCEASAVFAEASTNTEILQTDYAANGIRPLWGAMTVPSEIFTGQQKITSLADVEGLTLRGSGGTLEAAIAAMGATTLTLPTTEVYQALETGTADGTAMATASVESYSIDEVTRYATQGMQLGSFYTSYAISADAWEQLPDDVKQAFETANAEALQAGCEATEAATADAKAAFESQGMEFSELDVADTQQLRQIYDDVAAGWTQQNAQNGGDAVLEFIQGRLAEEA